MSPAAGSSNGRTPPSGGGYLGSNPSPAAGLGNAVALWRRVSWFST